MIVNAYHEQSNNSALKAQFYWGGKSQFVDVLPKENHLTFLYTATGDTGGVSVSFYGPDLKKEGQSERLTVSSVDVQRIK